MLQCFAISQFIWNSNETMCVYMQGHSNCTLKLQLIWIGGVISIIHVTVSCRSVDWYIYIWEKKFLALTLGIQIFAEFYIALLKVIPCYFVSVDNLYYKHFFFTSYQTALKVSSNAIAHHLDDNRSDNKRNCEKSRDDNRSMIRSQRATRMD